MSVLGVRKFGVNEVKLVKFFFVILLSFVVCWMLFVIVDIVGVFKG